MYYFILAVFLLLSACGFSPVYNPTMQTGFVQTQLSSISIATIPNREGQMVRNHLIDRLHMNGSPMYPDYNLIVSPIEETIVEIGIDKDDEASRAQLRVAADFRLMRLSDNTEILSRTSRSVSSYNILSGQFTTFINERDAREQALRALADNIVTELEVHFKR